MRVWVLVTLGLFACNADDGRPGGSTTSTTGSGGGDGGMMMGGGNDLAVPTNGTLTIDPQIAMLTITPAGPPATQAFTVKLQTGASNDDVSSLCSYSLDDPTLGTMTGSTFTTSGAHGGTANLTATYQGGSMVTAQIIVGVGGGFSAPDCGGCGMFPPDSAPSCAAAAGAPTLVYPSDGVLLPPNMEQLAIHFLPVTGAQQYEVDFSNAATNVRIQTKCTTLTNGGCILNLTPSMWDFIAKTNRGGDAISVKVRATTDGACATPSAASVNINVAAEDVTGAIYYWKSTVSAAGTGGQIWRKSFGDNVAEEQITNTGGINGTCFGCHFLSRDGKRMAVNGDDDDSDDEYSDVNSGLVDIASKMFITMGTTGRAGPGLTQPPGFQTFSPDHTLYLGSDGEASGGTPNAFFQWNGDTGNAAAPATVTGAGAALRVTMPDWSGDNKNVVFVVPAMTGVWPGRRGSMHLDDDHVLGGSLWTMPYMGNGAFGAPASLVASAGENNYYPSYSPDGAFVIFNRVDHQTTTGAADNDSFSNPKAKVWILSTAAGASGPINCAQLNATGDLSNSWPRWSPFVQTYKGSKLLWVTFSSTRDYGVQIKNSAGGLVQCYPPDSYEDPTGTHGQPFPANCKQPQLWMAAINLSTAEFHPDDPSFPAFWLPFQDPTTHNHTAQWTTTAVTMTPPDAGSCIPSGQDCTKAPDSCCAGLCLSTGTCGVP